MKTDIAEKIRLIAFYLPQFHPIPENDEWWGKGFTEWTNVTKATPLFEGHYQPHLPADFGFYDLRLAETRHDQIKMAKQYGIDGFCYYYYWFSGTRILNRPLDDMLSDPESDMPFCLCWANENWTRRWDGLEDEVLIAQRYLPDDDLNFIKNITPFLTDPRYIKINGEPILIVYRPQNLPDPKTTVSLWREYCRSKSIGEIHLSAVLTFGNNNYEQFGFDSGVEFPPHEPNAKILNKKLLFHQPFQGSVSFFHEVADYYLGKTYPSKNVFRGVLSSWDNTARASHRASIILNGTPKNYEYWLDQAIRHTIEDFPNQERFIFINAWNEWAEGCHLEPDRKYQRQFLEATLRVKNGVSEYRKFENINLPPLFVGKRINFIDDLFSIAKYHLSIFLDRIFLWIKRHERFRNIARKFFTAFR